MAEVTAVVLQSIPCTYAPIFQDNVMVMEVARPVVTESSTQLWLKVLHREAAELPCVTLRRMGQPLKGKQLISFHF
ncbi:hypothetical protein BA725_06440 [Agrobacterium pusense]|nr:hypothetical protein BA725_06440 [Agrobacterium pusense]